MNLDYSAVGQFNPGLFIAMLIAGAMMVFLGLCFVMFLFRKDGLGVVVAMLIAMYIYHCFHTGYFRIPVYWY
jgi:hypothetical protein